MVTSQMTQEQIDQACAIFRAQLTEHADQYYSDDVGRVLNQQGYAEDLLRVHRRRVMAMHRSFVREIDYDALMPIDRELYDYVEDLIPADYPETEKGKKLVRFQFLERSLPVLDDEIISKATREGCRLPTRIEAETVIRGMKPEEFSNNPVIALMERIVPRHLQCARPTVQGHTRGLVLHWHYVEDLWEEGIYRRFLVVFKEG